MKPALNFLPIILQKRAQPNSLLDIRIMLPWNSIAWIGLSILLLCHGESEAFLTSPPSNRAKQYELHANNPKASLVGPVPDQELAIEALTRAGIDYSQDDDEGISFVYKWSPAVGMLQLLMSNKQEDDGITAPKWIPVIQEQENVLVKNGWSFLDEDESEALSPFDVDAANIEGLYKPKWSEEVESSENLFSSIGFSLGPMSAVAVEDAAAKLTNDLSRDVLLRGKTDPPGLKTTSNGFDFAGSVTAIPQGIFCCAIGDLPLFSSADLSVSTASSGWLSFANPLCNDHVIHINPDKESPDQRIEVICAKSRCHLGHYFGPGEGYCINASVLNFVAESSSTGPSQRIAPVVSYRSWQQNAMATPSFKILDRCLSQKRDVSTIVVGGGCFWSIEHALRRLPGVVDTKTGYAGGKTNYPTYESVCQGGTDHAETVMVEFDQEVLHPTILVECFLAIHDPTKVRALGKHAAEIGQYRSCIFVPENESNVYESAVEAMERCRCQLGKELSTEIKAIDASKTFFWEAEERHQRHDERRNEKADPETNTLPLSRWLERYGKRKQSVVGSSQTLNIEETFNVERDESEEALATMRFLI